MCDLTAPLFQSDPAAREHLEALRWPNGPVCPHCGHEGGWPIKGGRAGLYKCSSYPCRKQFSVTVGTVFERSKVPLHKWLMAVHLMCASKKGMSAKQIERMLGVTYKTAWFICHRIREAMRPNGGGLLGSGGGVVEADETYIGRKPGKPVRVAWGHKNTVFSLVERGGQVRSVHIAGKMFDGIKASLYGNVSRDARLSTDEAKMYKRIAQQFAEHTTVKHKDGEYVRGEAHTNTLEGYFSVFKRGMKGVYQHCGSQHLHRYLSEFDFRYNYRSAAGYEDAERAAHALRGIEGKRLMYRDSSVTMPT